MHTMIRSVFRRPSGRTFVWSLGLILTAEVLVLFVASLALQYNVNRWVAEKTSRALLRSQEAAATFDWSAIGMIRNDTDSPTNARYQRELAKLSKDYFPAKDGDVYLVRIERGEEYAIGAGDQQLTDSASANSWERAAYTEGRSISSASPISDEGGTYIVGYTPIVQNGKVQGLIAAAFDSAPLADLQGIGWRTFWLLAIAATVFSIIVSALLASMFASLGEFIQEVQTLRQEDPRVDESVEQLLVGLTDQQRKVAELIGFTLSNREIAAKLGISQNTVKSHVAAALQRTKLSRDELMIALAVARRPPPTLGGPTSHGAKTTAAGAMFPVVIPN